MTDITKIGTDDAQESLVSSADDSSAQILRTIEVVEEHLREKRSRIEDIQSRHDDLVEEMRQLDKTLESESLDFVSSLQAVIDDLDADGASTAAEPTDLGAKGKGRGKPAQKPAKEKPAKRGSLRWLKDKDRSRRDASKQLISDAED